MKDQDVFKYCLITVFVQLYNSLIILKAILYRNVNMKLVILISYSYVYLKITNSKVIIPNTSLA